MAKKNSCKRLSIYELQLIDKQSEETFKLCFPVFSVFNRQLHGELLVRTTSRLVDISRAAGHFGSSAMAAMALMHLPRSYEQKKLWERSQGRDRSGVTQRCGRWGSLRSQTSATL